MSHAHAAAIGRGMGLSTSIATRAAGFAPEERVEVNAFHRFSRARGFTLIEVLLVLALLALVGTLLLPGVNSMLGKIDDRGPAQLLGEAVLAARLEALETGRTVELRYDRAARRFTRGAPDPRAAPLPIGSTIELLPVTTGASILLGGELAESAEPLRRVRFFPDGTCEPFRVRLAGPGARPRLLLVDPWTCAVSPAPAKGGS